jgi:hypothetical protein
VVCRIFQKAGPGPQNGAQYGAPYVEEEGEDVGLLPVGEDAVAERGPPGAMDKGYLQMSDLVQVYLQSVHLPLHVFLLLQSLVNYNAWTSISATCLYLKITKT